MGFEKGGVFHQYVKFFIFIIGVIWLMHKWMVHITYEHTLMFIRRLILYNQKLPLFVHNFIHKKLLVHKKYIGVLFMCTIVVCINYTTTTRHTYRSTFALCRNIGFSVDVWNIEKLYFSKICSTELESPTKPNVVSKLNQ